MIKWADMTSADTVDSICQNLQDLEIPADAKTFAFSKLGNFFKNVLFQILKGTVAGDFLFQIFFINHFHQAPENNTLNFFENSRRK
jgi:hypothetical protein